MASLEAVAAVVPVSVILHQLVNGDGDGLGGVEVDQRGRARWWQRGRRRGRPASQMAAGRASAPAATAKAASRLRLAAGLWCFLPVCAISGVFLMVGHRGHGTSWVAQVSLAPLEVVTTVITIAHT